MCRGLFEKNKPLFSFLMVVAVLVCYLSSTCFSTRFLRLFFFRGSIQVFALIFVLVLYSFCVAVSLFLIFFPSSPGFFSFPAFPFSFVQRHSGAISFQEWSIFLRSGSMVNKKGQLPKPDVTWIPESVWDSLDVLDRGVEVC